MERSYVAIALLVLCQAALSHAIDGRVARTGRALLDNKPGESWIWNKKIQAEVDAMAAKLPKGKDLVIVSKSSSMKGHLKCDGDRDEIEISAAIKAGAKKVTLSDGTFIVQENLYLRNDLIFAGQGMDRTTIFLANKAPVWQESGIIRGSRLWNIRMRDFTLDGNRQNNLKKPENAPGRFGFYCENCHNVLIERLKVKSFTGYGLDPHGIPRAADFSDGFIVRNSIVTDNGFDGITIDKTLNAIVENNTVTNNGRHGVNIVTGSKNVMVRNNKIYDNGKFFHEGSRGCGINVVDQVNHRVMFGTQNVTLVNNDVRGNTKHAVCVTESDVVKVIRNTLKSETKQCIDFRNSDMGHIEGNNCFDKAVLVRGKYDRGSFKAISQTVAFK